MGRSQGKNKKLAATILSGASININGGQRSKLEEFDQFLLFLKSLRETAIAEQKVAYKPESLNWENKILSELDFSALNLSGSNFKNINFREAVFSYQETEPGQEASLSHGPWKLATLLKDSLFEEVNFNKANLAGVSFHGSSIKNASFVAANLTAAQLIDLEIEQTSFTKADFDYAVLKNIEFVEDVDFRSSFFKESVIKNCDLANLDFYMAKIEDSSFFNSDFNNITLEGSEISRVKISSDKSVIDAVGADFSSADINLLEFKNKVDLTTASFEHSRVTYSDFINAKLSLAHLSESFFDGCNFNGADFNGAFVDGATFQNCSFVGVDLTSLEGDAQFRDCLFN